MSNKDLDAEREERISMEIIVDAYTDEEQHMGWYYYVAENLQFPFPAEYTIKKRSSPTLTVKTVSVVGIASEYDCERDILVEVDLDGNIIDTPLSQLEAPNADPQTQQAISDWHYWIN